MVTDGGGPRMDVYPVSLVNSGCATALQALYKTEDGSGRRHMGESRPAAVGCSGGTRGRRKDRAVFCIIRKGGVRPEDAAG